MTDLEITRLCAYANGEWDKWQIAPQFYDPLHDDAQAMALVKKFELRLDHNDKDIWSACKDHGFKQPPDQGWNPDLNRAICECVAKMALDRQPKV